MLPADMFSVKSLIQTILFVLLIPGFLLVVPDAKGAVTFGTSPEIKKMMSAVMVHALVFHVLNQLLTQSSTSKKP
jgi:hypothetical protein